MLNERQNKMLLEAVDLLARADALIQQVMNESDECYFISSQVENALEDVLEFIQENNEANVE